ncbi:twin-arginine translocase subunit TatC [Halogeometricum limi]|uniref:Sec-independent protein translocase protein (TatC) n=1 Tax=Halogeometricum limi TaxID=555875 RepID=A0A1I6HN51_9EURY|nr:twin-arginine translocase subunit TatC [Halogeometricum limi]SFR55866.1 Sec-independent protein translocase protein (TatC) [Halogeometricum limi]
MRSDHYAGDGVGVAAGSPVTVAFRRAFPSLVATLLVVSALVTAVALPIRFTDLVPVAASSPVPSSRPLTEFRLAVEAGVLAGFLATGVVFGRAVARDARVSASRARRHVALSAVLFLAGALGAAVTFPAVVELVAPFAAGAGSSLGPYWLAELWLFFPVALGAAAATPALLAAATRAGLVDRFTTTRQRGSVAFVFVAFAACFSPTDGATFVLFAAPLFAAFAAAVAWQEFR